MKLTHPDNPLQCMHVNVCGTGTVRHCTGIERDPIYGGSELAYAPVLGIWTHCGRFFVVMLPDSASIPQMAGQVFDGTRTDLDFPWEECDHPGADEVSGPFGNCRVRRSAACSAFFS